ncbi:MAG: FAD-binding oxidoreductase [Pseudomonadota bacterium]|nr:FAD-binding oxidoreductase [Pseudomonadota bacterium]
MAQQAIQTWFELTTENKVSYESLEVDAAADVVIIGGGITAVSAAYAAAEKGQSCIILESSTIAYGSTGRMGGQLTAGFNCFFDDLVDIVGRGSAIDMWQRSIAAREEMIELADTLEIDCDISRGILVTAKHNKFIKMLEKAVSQLSLWVSEDPIEMLDEKKAAMHLGSQYYDKVVYYAKSASFHPTKYLYGLAKAAVDKGVRIYEYSPVKSINTGQVTSITLENGKHVKAGKVIVCGTAYMNNVQLPNKARTVAKPVYQIVSKPMDEKVLQSLMPLKDSVKEFGPLGDSLSIMGNRLMMIGSGRMFAAKGEKLTNIIQKKWLKVFPQLHNLEVDYIWNHYSGVAMNFMPVFEKKHEDVFIAHGLTGHGQVSMYLAGKTLAEAALGDMDAFEQFSRIEQLKLMPVTHHAIAKMDLAYRKFMQYIYNREEQQKAGE